MKPSFHPKLINDTFSDPGLFVPFAFEKRALLFDLGNLQNLSPKELLKISHIFVTHAHIDHFIGFDLILRLFLGREKELHIYGPPDFFQRIEGKLSGYTWNLVHEYETDFRLRVTEVRSEKCITRFYTGRNHFQNSGPDVESAFHGVILEEPAFKVKADLFDHRIPSLGYALEENFHININKEALKELDLAVGPWITRFKKALYEKQDPGNEFIVPVGNPQSKEDEKRFRLDELSEKIARVSPGLKITYLTDIAGNKENMEKAINLAAGSDLLFIEASFLDRDAAVARKKDHLTAKQAGEIAGKAGVRQLIPFHFSPRYSGHPELLQGEAMEAFLMKKGE